MKIIKTILILATISFFTSVPFKAEARDCSEYKVLSHKWLMCNAGTKKYGTDAVKSSSTKKKAKKPKKTKEVNPDSINEKYKTLVDIFKKN